MFACEAVTQQLLLYIFFYFAVVAQKQVYMLHYFFYVACISGNRVDNVLDVNPDVTK
jgi:hypothetical protein